MFYFHYNDTNLKILQFKSMYTIRGCSSWKEDVRVVDDLLSFCTLVWVLADRDSTFKAVHKLTQDAAKFPLFLWQIEWRAKLSPICRLDKYIAQRSNSVKGKWNWMLPLADQSCVALVARFSHMSSCGFLASWERSTK